jgi:calnexin
LSEIGLFSDNVYNLYHWTFQKSVVQAVLDATNERPWLWAVFILVVVLPIVLVIAYCCMSGSKPEDIARHKKTDEPSPDDEVKEEDEEESEDKGEDKGAGGDSDNNKAKKSSKGALEAEDDNEADAEDEEENEKPETRSSPRKRKNKPQKE